MIPLPARLFSHWSIPLNEDPNHDKNYHFNANPYPLQSDGNLPIFSLHASIVSVHGPTRLHFKPLKLLNFDFNAGPDPAFHYNADPDPASKNNADPDPQF
jgi:hypothetical protein